MPAAHAAGIIFLADGVPSPILAPIAKECRGVAKKYVAVAAIDTGYAPSRRARRTDGFRTFAGILP
jgi:hypothetical protein